ncbi:MAG: O-antigen ligase family protein [Frankiaceae bacterium]|nr:O-antigen ligase family protein [Frankiaceae bacterium]
MPSALLTVERVGIASATTLTAVLFLPALADPVNIVKLTVLVLCALVAGLCAVLRVLQERIVRVPRSPAVYAGAALLLALVLTAVTAPTTTTAVIGTYGRNNGLVAYAAALLLFFLGARAWDVASTPLLLLALLAGGLFTAVYGLFQYAGIDAIGWSNPFNPIIGALGNPDFASAYVGICVPAAAWGVLQQGWALPARLACAAAGALCLLTAGLSSAIQGPAAAAAGVAVLAAAWLLNRGGATARRGLATLAGLILAGAGLVAAGAAHRGPLTSTFATGGGEARGWYWQGAIHMWRDHAVLGVGLDHFGAYWRQVRPAETTRRIGPEFTDAAHSVPLQMLAEGGVVLGVIYLAFLVLVGVALVRGLRRLQGQARLTLGAVGGVWLAYVVQAAVSIDQVPLLTVLFVSAGAVVALAGAEARELRLPGALRPVEATGRRRGGPPPQRAWSAADTAIASAVAVGCLMALWFALLPMRASAAARNGDEALAGRDGNTALAAYQKATRLLPGVGQYWEKTASLLEAVQQPAMALDAYRRGTKHDPYDVPLLVSGAKLAGTQQDEALQGRLLHRALRLDPTDASIVLDAAAYDAGHGDLAGAGAALDRCLRALPDNADLWAARGQVHAAGRDDAKARQAFERALALTPDHPVATAGLKALDSRA